MKVFANISCDGLSLSGDSKDIAEGHTDTLLLHLPTNALAKEDCRLRMEAFYLNLYCDLAFLHENHLQYVQHSRLILLQTDKPLYMQGDTVRFRVTVTSYDLKPSNCVIEVFIIDPNQHIVRRWLMQLPVSGTITLEYRLIGQPSFGEWTINVGIAEQGGQQEELKFIVEKYYSTRFELEVRTPSIFYTNSAFIKGRVIAISALGEDETLFGKLTLKAIIYPFGYLNSKTINEYFRLGLLNKTANITAELFVQTELLTKHSFYKEPLSSIKSLSQKFIQNFNGKYIFKWPKDELEKLEIKEMAHEVLITATVVGDNDDEFYAGYAIAHIYEPRMRLFFLGGDRTQTFIPSLPNPIYIGIEKLNGASIDANLLRNDGFLEVSGSIETIDGATFEWPKRRLRNLKHNSGIWELKVDLRNDVVVPQMSRDAINAITQMRLRAKFRIRKKAQIITNDLEHGTSAELLLMASFHVPHTEHIRVTTSTEESTVGEYMIFEITTSFYVEHFDYIILSKGVIVTNGRATLDSGMHTMAVVLTLEMTPVAEIVVWTVSWQGELVMDVLSFPVMGVFIKNFSLQIHRCRAERCDNDKSDDDYDDDKSHEIIILGEPMSHVSLSAVTLDAYKMQPDNYQFSYINIVKKMSTFERDAQKLYQHLWYFYQNENANGLMMDSYDAVYYPSTISGLNANETLFVSGLIALTDAVVPQRFGAPLYNRKDEATNDDINKDNAKFGRQCSTGTTCFPLKNKCDALFDCIDASDECGCRKQNIRNRIEFLVNFYKFRYNRIRRHYKTSPLLLPLWRDIDLDYAGRAHFDAKFLIASQKAEEWILNGYSTSSSSGGGIGIANATLISVEAKQMFVVDFVAPPQCRINEQFGSRISIANKRNVTLRIGISLRSNHDVAKTMNTSIAAHAHQLILLPLKALSVGHTQILIQFETHFGERNNITHHLNVISADVITSKLQQKQQQRQQHHYYVEFDLNSNFDQQKNSIVKYLNFTNFSTAAGAAKTSLRISLIEDAFTSLFVTTHNDSDTISMLHTAQEFAYAFANNLYALMYRRSISRQQHSERQIYHQLYLNYQRLLSYLQLDGSFAHFHHKKSDSSSVLLTAHCLNLFQQASAYKMNEYIWIDETIVAKTLNWLLHQQSTSGAWLIAEAADFQQNSYTLTAHVLIVLCQQNEEEEEEGRSTAVAKRKAIAWIERNLADITECYDVSVVTYALLLCKSSLAEESLGLLRSLATRQEMPPNIRRPILYWSCHPKLTTASKDTSLSIETTAYALLSYLLEHDSNAVFIANWLNLHNLHSNNWYISKRALFAAKRALVAFTQAHPRRRTSTEITVELMPIKMRASRKFILYINNSNLAEVATPHSIQLHNVWSPLKITAKGVGYAMLEVRHEFDVADNVVSQQLPPVFRITNTVFCRHRHCLQIAYHCCINLLMNTKHTERAGISVLDIAVPSGYRVQQQQLDAYVLSRRVAHLVQAQFMETKVMFYFINLIHEEEVCVNLTLRHWFVVTNRTNPLVARIYLYNEPEYFAETTFIAPLMATKQLQNICTICDSSSCQDCPFNGCSKVYFTLLPLFQALLLVVMYFH